MFMKIPFSRLLHRQQVNLYVTPRLPAKRKGFPHKSDASSQSLHVVVNNDRHQARPTTSSATGKIKSVIVERQNILPFVNYAPYKEKLTREEMLEKILIKNEDVYNRPIRKAIILFYWIYIALMINAGLVLFYYL